jgi:CRP-like cAMP-binding protein
MAAHPDHYAALLLPSQTPQPANPYDVLLWDTFFMGSALWPAGTQLFMQGELPEVVYLLNDGIVKFVHIDEQGQEFVVNLQRAPALLGAASAIAREPHASMAVAATNCQVRWCAATDFMSAVDHDSKLAAEIRRLQSVEIVELSRRIAIMGIKSSHARLYHFLHAYCSHSEHTPTKSKRVHLPLKQSEIASFIGITPEHMSRTLRKLLKEGRIRKSNGWLLI